MDRESRKQNINQVTKAIFHHRMTEIHLEVGDSFPCSKVFRFHVPSNGKRCAKIDGKRVLFAHAVGILLDEFHWNGGVLSFFRIKNY